MMPLIRWRVPDLLHAAGKRDVDGLGVHLRQKFGLRELGFAGLERRLDGVVAHLVGGLAHRGGSSGASCPMPRR